MQHWRYCPRQCGLIHLEQVFDDNLATLRGQAVHTKADLPGVDTAKGVRVERALPLWHDALGLIGKADDLQLAAQALCLEAMTGQPVPEGALYYASSKRRRVVPITAQLRADVAQTAQAIRHMLASGQLPPPLTGAQAAQRCKGCSLQERCQPQATHASLMAARQSLFDPDA